MAFPQLAVYSTGSVLNAGIIAASARIGGLLTLLWGGWLADQWGGTVAALCFAAIFVPFAIAGHAAKSLTPLRTPLDLVEEVPTEAAAKRVR